MKKILAALMLISLLIGACSKSTKHSAGTWTFKNVTYSPTFANYVLGAFTAYTQENLPSGSLAFTFYDTTDRAHNDTFGITTFLTPYATAPRVGTFTYHLSDKNPPPMGYVFVRMTDTAATRSFICVPSDSAGVTVNFDGKITEVTASNIVLRSNTVASDSGFLTARITQLNYK